MGIILNSQNKNQLSKLKKHDEVLILVGGCFDILHAGHIEFLKNAKKLGDTLVVLLESDARISKLKGDERPVNTQEDRAVILSNLPMVSYVYNLPEQKNDSDYQILVKTIQPDIIALTDSDKIFNWEKDLERTGKLKIVRVMDKKKHYSTTRLVRNLEK